MESTEKKLLNWSFSGDTGSSSNALAAFFSGAPNRSSDYPHDPDDFGRCYRLLRAVPELRARIGEAAVLSKSWAALIGAWDELEALYEQFCDADGRRIDADGYPAAKKMYQRMQDLTKNTSRDEGWVHFKGMSMKAGA